MSSRAAWLHLAGKALFQALGDCSFRCFHCQCQREAQEKDEHHSNTEPALSLSKSLTSRARGLCDIVLGGVE